MYVTFFRFNNTQMYEEICVYLNIYKFIYVLSVLFTVSLYSLF